MKVILSCLKDFHDALHNLVENNEHVVFLLPKQNSIVNSMELRVWGKAKCYTHRDYQFGKQYQKFCTQYLAKQFQEGPATIMFNVLLFERKPAWKRNGEGSDEIAKRIQIVPLTLTITIKEQLA